MDLNQITLSLDVHCYRSLTMDLIPAALRSQLFPSPLMSVANFLCYALPTQLPDAVRASSSVLSLSDIAMYEGHHPPDARNIVETVQRLPIPPANHLTLIVSSSKRSKWISVRYAHLSLGSEISTAYFPPWIVEYWVEVTHLQAIVRRPWLAAENFLKTTQQMWKAAGTREVGDVATLLLLQLPWGGQTAGFGKDNEPMHLMSRYLSHRWLQSTHINQQLDILRFDLQRAGIINCEITSPYTFDIIAQMHQAREGTPYCRDGAGVRKNIWGIGEELSSGRRKVLASVTNVNGNHWVAIVVNATNFTVKYGDSFGSDRKSELVDAVTWWLQFHIPTPFRSDGLSITKQEDGFSCGVLSIDAVRHAILPGAVLIQPSSSAAIQRARVEMFVRVGEREAELVRQTWSFYISIKLNILIISASPTIRH